MPYRRNDSPYWWISWTDADGRRRARSSETADHRQAKALEHQLRADAGRIASPHAAKLIEDTLQPYLEQVRSRRAAYAVKPLLAYFGGRPVAEITPGEIAGYKQHRQVTAATVRRELGVLGAAIRWCNREYGWELPDPTAGRKPREPPGRIRWITCDQADALIRAAASEPKAPHLADYIRLGLHTGLRSSEMLELEWARVDLSTRSIHLYPQHQKAARHSAVPLNDMARDAILSRAAYRAQNCPSSPWVFCTHEGERIHSIKRSFRTAARRAGIDDYHPHDLRHTCASWLVQAGVPLRTVAEILRHRDIHTTMRYAHLAPDDARAGLALLERSEIVATGRPEVPDVDKK
jgi:integrase